MKLHDLAGWEPFLHRHRAFRSCYNCLNGWRRRAWFRYRQLQCWWQHVCSRQMGVAPKRAEGPEVVVSLTTFGPRLKSVYLAIESVMQGSVKPQRIVLWLADELKGQPLPLSLQRQMKRGLQVCYCPEWRSFKKLVPALQQYPEACLVTIDDDQLYDRHLLQYLLESYAEHPLAVHANEVYRITSNGNGKIGPYVGWLRGYADHDVSPLNFPIGEGGVLYPPHCLDAEVLNEAAFMRLCPTADDVWFYAMALKKGVCARKTCTADVRGEVSIENPTVQQGALKYVNVEKGLSRNDVQFQAVFDAYGLFPQFLDLLKRCEHESENLPG